MGRFRRHDQLEVHRPRHAPPDRAGTAPVQLLELQRTAGNQAVGVYLQRLRVGGTDYLNAFQAATLLSDKYFQRQKFSELKKALEGNMSATYGTEAELLAWLEQNHDLKPPAPKAAEPAASAAAPAKATALALKPRGRSLGTVRIGERTIAVYGVGGRYDAHVEPATTLAYLRDFAAELQPGEQQYLPIGDGRRQRNRLYGQVIYAFDGRILHFWHAHTSGKMG